MDGEELAAIITAALNLDAFPALPFCPEEAARPMEPWTRWIEALGRTCSPIAVEEAGEPVPLSVDPDLEFDTIVDRLQAALEGPCAHQALTVVVNPHAWPHAHQEILRRLLLCGQSFPIVIIGPRTMEGALGSIMRGMDRLDPVDGGAEELTALLASHGAPPPTNPNVQRLLTARLPAGPAAVRAQLDAWTHAGILTCAAEGWRWSEDADPSLVEMPAPDHLWPALWSALPEDPRDALRELEALGGTLAQDLLLKHLATDASILTRLMDEGWISPEFHGAIRVHPGALAWLGGESTHTTPTNDRRRRALLESMSSERDTTHTNALSQILMRAGETDRAGDLMAEVAAALEDGLAPLGAGKAWIEAGRLATEPGVRTERLDQGIRLLIMGGERDTAETHLRELLAGDESPLIALLRAHAAIHAGTPQDALKALTHTPAGEASTWSPAQRMQAALARGTAHSLQGDHADARHHLEDAEAIATALEDRHAIGRITNNLGNLAFQSRDWSGAVAAYQRSLVAKEAIHDLRGVRIARANRALALRQQGELALAIADLDAAHTLAQRIGDAPGAQFVALVRGHTSLDCAQITHAEDALAQFLQVEAGSLAMELEGEMLLARLRRSRGEFQEAMSLLMDTQKRADAAGFGVMSMEAIVALRHAVVLHERSQSFVREDPSVTAVALEQALTRAHSSGDASGSLSLRAALCHGLTRTGDWEQARALLPEIIAAVQAGLAPGEECALAFGLWAAEHLGDLEGVRTLQTERDALVVRRLESAHAIPSHESIRRGGLLRALGIPDSGPERAMSIVRAYAPTEVQMSFAKPFSALAMSDPGSPVEWATTLAEHFQASSCIFLALSGEGDPILGQAGSNALPSSRWRETQAAMRRGFPFFAPSTGAVELAAWPLGVGEDGPCAALLLTWEPGKGFQSAQIDGLVQPLRPWAALMASRAVLARELDAALQSSRDLEDGLSRSTAIHLEEVSQLRDALHHSRAASELQHRYEHIVHESTGMRRVLRMLEKVMHVDLPVMLRGESGVGKEVLARALHHNGPRAAGPFIGENCAAIPPDLFESIFFGHVRGAFTGAITNQSGLLEAADGGTLFLDEFGELRADHQVKLLRVLQEKTFRPVGSQREISVDFRLITATNQDLEALVERGEFREDLYWRAAVVAIDIPPLRKRRDDILPLVNHFLKGITEPGSTPIELQPGAADALIRHDWPGNVRELQNAILRASALTGSNEIRVEHLSPRVLAKGPRKTSGMEWDGVSPLADLVDALERKAILTALESAGGQKAGAARQLGISRPGLDAKMNRLEIPYTRGKATSRPAIARSH
jgi:DNA-binding NtrC family response regulator/tetratricopeptide (TPR) repeat protein